MLKSLILKSKIIYAILSIGIAACLLCLTANISYGIGQERAAGYSEEYLQLYGAYMWAYAETGIQQETASEWAVSVCNLQVGK